MSELLDKQVNAQKESLKNTSGARTSSCKSTKKCAMKMKQRNKERKNDACIKMLLMEEGVYRACVENSCHGYQQASN